MVQPPNKPMLDLRAVAPLTLDFGRFKLEDLAGHCEVFPAQWMERTSGFGIFAPDLLFTAVDRLSGIFANPGYQSVPVTLARVEYAKVDLVLGCCRTSDGTLVTETAFVARAIDPTLLSSGFEIPDGLEVHTDETVLHCFHRAAGAFGHYLADCLPIAALFLSELITGRMKLLIPPNLPDWAVRGLQDIGVNRECCIFPQGSVLHCRRLVLPSTLDTSSTIHPNAELLRVLRAAAGLKVPGKGGRRLWLSRLSQQSFSHRRLSNEAAVQAVLGSLGFEVLEPGNMPLPAQIEAFANAEIIAGVHGSSFGNLAFANPGTRVIDLMPDKWIDFWGPANTAERWLQRLTTALDLDYAVVLCPSILVRVLLEDDKSGLQHFGMDCRVDLDLLVRSISAPLPPAGRRGTSTAPSIVTESQSLGKSDAESVLLAADGRVAIALFSWPVLEPLFRLPDRRGVNSAWWGHVPFAGWIMGAARPRILVELGTFSGVSYSAFCQSAIIDRISTQCHAVDTWAGDPHAGTYDDTTYMEFKEFHDTHYAAISQMHRCTFDEAQVRFDDGTIDLLHIDGYHTYDAVRHDFETWRPKLSSRAVVLFHDTNEKMNDFGVWRFWEEVSIRWPSFSFYHSHGLGVLCVGAEPPPSVAALCTIQDPDQIRTLQQRFALLGDRWYAQSQWEVVMAQAAANAEQAAANAEKVSMLEQSVSWRITAPLRSVSSRIRWVARLVRSGRRL